MMMMKAQVFVLLLLMSTIQSWSQQIERHVTGSAGGFFDGENESISWTIGEPVSNTISNDSHKLTQGFHQGRLKVESVFIAPAVTDQTRVYPNPVRQELIVETKNTSIIYKLFDVDGHLLISSKIQSSREIIDVSELPEGVYLLHLGDYNTHRIIKQE